jgi:glutamate-1-semialdehyde 2,1-aminomutase
VSEALAAIARQNYPGGVPMHWMLDWETPVPLSIVSASGATIEDADGLSYADFCLGDSGALFGHSPPAVARAITDQAKRGLTAMLPGPDTAFVGQQLARLLAFPSGRRPRPRATPIAP